MSGFLLDTYPSGSTIYAHFHSFDSNGASITLTGLAAADIEIYKNGSVTQRASDAGYALLDTDGIDFDAVTGIHGVSIDLADNTDAGFYTVGAQFTVVLSSVTIDTRTVNLVLGSFRILAAESISGTPKADVAAWLGTAASTPTVAGVPNVNAKTWNDLTTVALPLVPTTAGRTLDVSAGGEAGVDWANVGSPTTVVGLSGTTVKTATDVETDTADIQSRLPAALVSGRIDASVGAMAANVITTTAINDGAFTAAKFAAACLAATNFAAGALDAVWSTVTRVLTAGTNIALAKGTGVTGFTDLSAADVRTAVGLASANLDTQIGDLPTNAELATSQAAADDATLAAIAALNNISTAQVNAEVDQALADVGLTTTITGRIDAATSSRLATVGYTAPPSAASNAAGLLDLADGVESGLTVRQHMRLSTSVLFGKSSGLDTATAIYRDFGDTKNRITATVDADGNRSAVTRDSS